jgi:endonuclease III
MSLEITRLILLSAWGIGPKVADSMILSTFKALHFIPCDVHLRKFITKLKLAEDFRMPEKNICKKFLCGGEPALGLDPCPSRRCLRAILRPLGELGGWMQTLIYLHGKEYCKSMRPRCSECPLKNLCPSSGIRIASRTRCHD